MSTGKNGKRKSLFYNLKKVREECTYEKDGDGFFHPDLKLETPECLTQSTPFKVKRKSGNLTGDGSKINRSVKRRRTNCKVLGIRRPVKGTSFRTTYDEEDFTDIHESDLDNTSDILFAKTLIQDVSEEPSPSSDLLLAKIIPQDASLDTSSKISSSKASVVNGLCEEDEDLWGRSMDEKMLLLNGTVNATIKNDDLAAVSFNSNTETTFLNRCIPSDCSDISDTDHDSRENDGDNDDQKIEKTPKTSCLFDMTKDNEQFAALNLTQISSNLLPTAAAVREYRLDTFYGLPMKVKDILLQNRGISKLYG